MKQNIVPEKNKIKLSEDLNRHRKSFDIVCENLKQKYNSNARKDLTSIETTA